MAMPPLIGIGDTETGKELSTQTLANLRKPLDALGLGQQFLERTTSPFVASRQARLETEELPFISNQLAGRGLSRSTIGAGELGKAKAGAERDINQIIADAAMKNELLKRQRRSEIERLGFDIGSTDARILSAQQMAQQQLGFAQEQANRQEHNQQQARLDSLIGGGLGMLGSLATSAATGGTSSMLGMAMDALKAKKPSGFTSTSYAQPENLMSSQTLLKGNPSNKYGNEALLASPLGYFTGG